MSPYFLLTWVLLLYNIDDSVSADIDSLIFESDPCKMHCYGKHHTLCNSNKSNASCLPTTSIISDGQNKEMKNMLIMGHNGIRNRIAEHMMVANMVEMVWQDELAVMAEKYIAKCKPYETDPCATLPQSDEHHEKHIHFSGSSKKTYHEVAQNRYLQKRIHYPNLLIENALRAWYMERDTMKAPTFEFNFLLQSEVGHMVSENNFTHLASPLSTHFGCAFNKVIQGYLLVCNYHPYRRRTNLQVDFFRGDPGTLCPISRPLRNSRESMTNLCIGVERNEASARNNKILPVAVASVKLIIAAFVNEI